MLDSLQSWQKKSLNCLQNNTLSRPTMVPPRMKLPGGPTKSKNHTWLPCWKLWHLTLSKLLACWQVTLPIYNTIQSKLQWHLHPFLSSSSHHSQTANVSSQSVLPIITINMLSNSIPLQLMSRWSLDSDDYHAHVNIQNQLHSQHPPASTNCSTLFYAVPISS